MKGRREKGTGVFFPKHPRPLFRPYLGAWPKPGFLDLLPIGLGGGAPDAQGYSQVLLGVWRRQWLDFSALAMNPQLLARVTPELAPEEVQDDAQVRIHVGDLSQAEPSVWVNNLTFGRAWLASVGNTAPLLEWFRGLDAELTTYEDRAVLRATLDLQRKPNEKPKFQLPRFNLFGSGKPASQSEIEEIPPPAPRTP